MIRFFNIILFSLLTLLLSASSIIHAGTSSEKSKELTKHALKEIDAHNFKSAYILIIKAIKLDPSNETAKKIYVNLEGLISLEESVPRIKPVPRIKSIPQKEPVPRIKSAPREDTEKQTMPNSNNTDVNNVKKVKTIPVSSSATGGFSFMDAGLMYTTGESNYLDYIDSHIKFLGVRAEAGRYFGSTGGRFGFSTDYTGNFFKTEGDSEIDFTQHRFNVFLSNRNEYLKNASGFLVIGFRAGYHYYFLNNKKEEGAYYYTKLYGPAFGIFLSDPLFYRIWQKSSIKSFGIEGGITCVYVFHADNPVLALEYNTGLTYKYGRPRFSLRWRSYRINNGDVSETFNNIELGTFLRI